MRFRVAFVQARIPHHFFGIMRPAFSEGIADEHFAEEEFGTVAMQEAQEMARRSEEHTSELQSLMRISYAVFCLKKKKYATYEYTCKTQQSSYVMTTNTY